jgi:Fe-Mn family superoxide dismutase
MSEPISRRDLIASSVPVVAALGFGALGSSAFAQDAAGAGQAGKSNVLSMLSDLGKDGTYALPKLPYAYDALEPHIDAQTMELHHSKHQAAYVTNLNKSIDSLAKLRDEPEIDAGRLAALSRDISFNAGGAILHTVFFGTMSPGKKGEAADTALTQAIGQQFGSLDKFKAHFSKVAAGVKGSGWAIACYEPIGGKILITESGDQDLRLIPASIPLLLIDVWEHAYYLKYQNRRADYIKAWWNCVDWNEVDALYGQVVRMYGR